jgi:hypothetical protein
MTFPVPKEGLPVIVEFIEVEYYTPDIEDIRVGYECEWIHLDKGWIKGVISEKILNDVFGFLFINKIEKRTPYLTKEQIEAEGWVEVPNRWFDTNKTQRMATVPDYELDTVFGKLKLFITNLKEVHKHISIERYTKADPNDAWSMSSFKTVYSGPCPSINEFRQIIKLLNT